MQIFSNATKGLVLLLTELRASDGKVYPLTKGPFTVAVDDNGTGIVTAVPGSDDETTPTIFRPSGTGGVGTVKVTVTDTSNGLVGTASFDIVAPTQPPPDAPDTLKVDFAPEP